MDCVHVHVEHVLVYRHEQPWMPQSMVKRPKKCSLARCAAEAGQPEEAVRFLQLSQQQGALLTAAAVVTNKTLFSYKEPGRTHKMRPFEEVQGRKQ